MKKVAVDPKVIRFPNGAEIPVERREWHLYCDNCNDSGWLNHWCGFDTAPRSWLIQRACGRTHEHYSHEWVRLCPCVATNPDVPARVKALAQAMKGE
jgi:hypothetical protein